MNKKNLYIIALVLITIFSVLITRFIYFGKFEILFIDKGLKWETKYKGLVGATDFAFDDKGNCYVAFKNRIQYIDISGKSYEILKDTELNINAIEEKDNTLYFASDSYVYSFDLATKNKVKIIPDLPNFGDYNKSILKFKGDDLYISIGAATNSGVVGEDNSWIKTNSYNCDVSPFDIELNANKIGGFVPYHSKNIQSQNISGHIPGNASIMKFNIKTKDEKNFAWGIRNVAGMDFDSQGKLYAAVGGMENRGLRPVKNDLDYIYEIKKDNWYGWPDYSGGDPITSPRFENSKVNFIIEKPPTINPSAPFYQHNQLSALGTLSVDRLGDLGTVDNIYFYDNKSKSILVYNNQGSIINLIGLENSSEISSMKFFKGYLFILDSKTGTFIQIQKL